MDGLATQCGMARQAAGLDIDLTAFISATGATDTDGLADIVNYLKSESLWGNAVFLPMLPNQNHGSGTTVESLGGITTANAVLTGSPAWQSDGIDFNGSSQYGTIDVPALQSSTSMFTICRIVPDLASTADSGTGSWFGFGDTNAGKVIGIGPLSTVSLNGETITVVFKKSGTNARLGATTAWSAGEDFSIVTEFSTTGSRLWKNKTSQTYSLSSGMSTSTDTSPLATGFSSNDNFNIATYTPGGTYYNGNIAAILLIDGSPTLTQRETLTDLMNAL